MRESKAVPQQEKPVRGELLTVDEAVEKTRHSRFWFYSRMANGTLPFPWIMTSPGKRFIDSADIDDWLRISKIPAGSTPGDI